MGRGGLADRALRADRVRRRASAGRAAAGRLLAARADRRPERLGQDEPAAHHDLLARHPVPTGRAGALPARLQGGRVVRPVRPGPPGPELAAARPAGRRQRQHRPRVRAGAAAAPRRGDAPPRRGGQAERGRQARGAARGDPAGPLAADRRGDRRVPGPVRRDATRSPTEAVQLLEDLARRGRSQGIHLVLASQDVSGIEAFWRRPAIFEQFVLRIGLPGRAGCSPRPTTQRCTCRGGTPWSTTSRGCRTASARRRCASPRRPRRPFDRVLDSCTASMPAAGREPRLFDGSRAPLVSTLTWRPAGLAPTHRSRRCRPVHRRGGGSRHRRRFPTSRAQRRGHRRGRHGRHARARRRGVVAGEAARPRRCKTLFRARAADGPTAVPAAGGQHRSGHSWARRSRSRAAEWVTAMSAEIAEVVDPVSAGRHPDLPGALRRRRGRRRPGACAAGTEPCARCCGSDRRSVCTSSGGGAARRGCGRCSRCPRRWTTSVRSSRSTCRVPSSAQRLLVAPEAAARLVAAARAGSSLGFD